MRQLRSVCKASVSLQENASIQGPLPGTIWALLGWLEPSTQISRFPANSVQTAHEHSHGLKIDIADPSDGLVRRSAVVRVPCTRPGRSSGT